MEHLARVCKCPQFGANISDVYVAVESFSSWLDTKIISHRVNLSGIDICTYI